MQYDDRKFQNSFGFEENYTDEMKTQSFSNNVANKKISQILIFRGLLGPAKANCPKYTI